MDASRVRERRPADLPALAVALLEQQPTTRYPYRDPLPVPVEEFLHAHDAVRAWTAEVAGEPVGQVCRVAAARTFAPTDPPLLACTEAYGCTVDELAWVGALFVGTAARGHGLGRRLLAAVVDDIVGDGLHPCLEVLPAHPAALALYAGSGWRTVHTFRPAWLTEAAGEAGPDVQVMVLLP